MGVEEKATKDSCHLFLVVVFGRQEPLSLSKVWLPAEDTPQSRTVVTRTHHCVKLYLSRKLDDEV